MIVLLTAAVVLVEWLAGSTLLTWPGGDYVPMAPLTAVLFLLIGGAILFHARRSLDTSVHPLVHIAPVLVLGVAGLMLAQFFARTQFGIASDLEWHIAPAPGFLGLVPLARMSPLTAVLFILLAGQTLAFARPQWRRAGDMLGSAVVAGAGVLVIGYWYGAPFLYGGRVVPVALSTAVLFLLGAIGLMAADPRSNLLRLFTSKSIQARFIRGVAPATVLLLLINGGIEMRVHHMMELQYYVLLSFLSDLFIALIISALIVHVSREVATRVLQSEQELRASEAEFRTQAEELQARNEELSRFNRDMSGRELHMIELKQEVNALAARFDQARPYALAFLDATPGVEALGESRHPVAAEDSRSGSVVPLPTGMSALSGATPGAESPSVSPKESVQ